MRMPMPNLVTPATKPAADAPVRPIWVDDLLAGCEAHHAPGSAPGSEMLVFDAPGHRLVRAGIKNASALSDTEFERATVTAYADIARQMQAPSTRHPVRIWNYLPDIHRVCTGGLDRYMVFNAARYQACCDWLG